MTYLYPHSHEGEPKTSPNVQVRMSMSLYIKLKEAAAYTTLSEWLRPIDRREVASRSHLR